MTAYLNSMIDCESPYSKLDRLKKYRLSLAISDLLTLNDDTGGNGLPRFGGSIIDARDLRGDNTIYFGFNERTPKIAREERKHGGKKIRGPGIERPSYMPPY